MEVKQEERNRVTIHSKELGGIFSKSDSITMSRRKVQSYRNEGASNQSGYETLQPGEQLQLNPDAMFKKANQKPSKM